MSVLGEVAPAIHSALLWAWSVFAWLGVVGFATIAIRVLRRRALVESLMFAAIAVITFHTTLDGPVATLLGATLTSTIDWTCLGLLYLILVLGIVGWWRQRRRVQSAQH